MGLQADLDLISCTNVCCGNLPSGSAITVGDERGCTGSKVAGGPAV